MDYLLCVSLAVVRAVSVVTILHVTLMTCCSSNRSWFPAVLGWAILPRRVFISWSGELADLLRLIRVVVVRRRVLALDFHQTTSSINPNSFASSADSQRSRR